MNHQPSLVLAAVVLVCSSGCATLAHGVRQTIDIDSEPSGASVLVDEKPAGVTPVSLKVWRLSTPTLRIQKDGFVTEVVRLKRHASGWLAADMVVSLDPMTCQGLESASDSCPQALMTNLVTLIGIDFITGAAFSFPKQVDVTLVPAAAGPPSAERTGAQATVIRLGS